MSNDSDIGPSSLSATRPLCIPVRFQPLGTANPSRWMGTGALAAAASTLPPPLPAHEEQCDFRDRAPSTRAWMHSHPCDARTEDDAAPDTATAATGGDLACASGTNAKPWLWPLVGALVLALVVLGGGAAWTTWQRRQRGRTALAALGGPATASKPGTDQNDPTAGAATAMVMPVAGAVQMLGPSSPTPSEYQRQQQHQQRQSMSPVFRTFVPQSTAPETFANAQPSNFLALPSTSPRPPSSPLLSPLRQQQQTATQAHGQTQARGTYAVVERPPLRMRNVAAGAFRRGDLNQHGKGPNRDSDGSDDDGHDSVERIDSDTDNDDDDDGGDKEKTRRASSDQGHHHPGHRRAARPVASGPRPTRAAGTFGRPPAASPQESHLDFARPIPAASVQERFQHDALYRGGGGAAPGYGSAPYLAPSNSHQRVNDRDDLHVRHASEHDDSLGDMSDDYWANAERARQTYFASPQERAAQVMRLGPRAYSPDGTPMPVRS